MTSSQPDPQQPFSLADPTLYRWQVENRKRGWLRAIAFLGGLFMPAVVTFLFLLLCQLVAGKWVSLAALALLGFSAFRGVRHVYYWKKSRKYGYFIAKRAKLAQYLSVALVALVFLLASFSPQLEDEFSGNISSVWQWCLAIFDQLLAAVTLDLTESLGIRFSSIASRSVSARLILLLFKVIITLVFIDLIIRIYEGLNTKQEFTGNTWDFYKWLVGRTDFVGDFAICKDGKLELFDHQAYVPMNAFLKRVKVAGVSNPLTAFVDRQLALLDSTRTMQFRSYAHSLSSPLFTILTTPSLETLRESLHLQHIDSHNLEDRLNTIVAAAISDVFELADLHPYSDDISSSSFELTTTADPSLWLAKLSAIYEKHSALPFKPQVIERIDDLVSQTKLVY